jgi:hypothetical protein
MLGATHRNRSPARSRNDLRGPRTTPATVCLPCPTRSPGSDGLVRLDRGVASAKRVSDTPLSTPPTASLRTRRSADPSRLLRWRSRRGRPAAPSQRSDARFVSPAVSPRTLALRRRHQPSRADGRRCNCPAARVAGAGTRRALFVKGIVRRRPTRTSAKATQQSRGIPCGGAPLAIAFAQASAAEITRRRVRGAPGLGRDLSREIGGRSDCPTPPTDIG